GPFLRVTVLFFDTYLLLGPHDLFQLLLNDNRDILCRQEGEMHKTKPIWEGVSSVKKGKAVV
ncbi:MAG: hypothetical protein M1274_02485, partial [Actinobacteria bacterium]|nr:hypothetical protein [Actinomycetota bacterium]